MPLCQIDELQDNVLAQFDSSLQKVETEVSELVFGLLATHPDTAEIALGKTGRQLIELINKIDLHHPDAASLIDHIFNYDEKFCQQTLEIIELADKCKHLSISSNFYKLVEHRKFVKLFFETQFSIRLLKSPQEQKNARNERKIQIINLKAFYKNGSEIWNAHPSDFQIFNRNKIPYIEHLELFEKKNARYLELGCEVISNKISEEIKQLRTSLRDRYYGFNRVKMTVASVVLAKMHGYKLRTSWDIHNNKLLNVIIPTMLSYEPRLYPFHKLRHLASTRVLQAIDHLDNFPEIGGKSLFDNFLVLVPSVEIKHDPPYLIKDIKGNTLKFYDKEEALSFLDINLIEKHSICPVVFGERNGKCYFLCYFKVEDE